MTIRRRLFGSIALSMFFGCAAGGTLLVDQVAPRDAVAQDVDDGYFYANLAPYGQWFFQADFGWVWHPARVSAGWRPYTEGQWVWAGDVGWTWASQEPWGWATYHYGRWYFDPMYGWSWVPGRTWAPAWVSWRVEAGYIGWAPLWPAYFDRHPEYRWDRWSHDRDWDRRHNGRDWDRWVFTRDRDFTYERVGRHAITDRSDRDRIFSRSRDVTKFDESRPERIGHSIDRAMVEKATGRPVRSVTIETADKPDAAVDTKGERIRMFRPAIKQAADKTPDRLGLAREPSRGARETDTLRQEKQRLDSVPDAEKARAKSARQPMVREKDGERGGGSPASAEREAATAGDRRPARPEKKEDRTPDAKADPADPAQKAAPAPRVKGERAPSGQKRPDAAEPAVARPPAQREPVQPDRAERKPAAGSREPAARPQREREPGPESQREPVAKPQREPSGKPQREPAARSQREPAAKPQREPAAKPAREQAPQRQQAQPREPAAQGQPAQQKRSQPDEMKKQPRPDEPGAGDSKGGEPGHGMK